MTLLLLYVALALGVSFLCSVMEAVLLSVTPGYVSARLREGGRTAGRLEQFKQNIDRPLSAILTLNTIAHTVGAAGAGAQAASVFGDVWLGVASGVLTLLILVVSEIIPKTLGAVYWRSLVRPVVSLLALLVVALWPFVKISEWITRGLASSHNPAQLDREEISALADLGREEGVLQSRESSVLKNLLKAEALCARDVMTPRPVVFALDVEQSVGAVMHTHPELRFSRIPVYEDNRENVTGYILKDSVLLYAARDRHDVPLSELRQEIATVVERTPLIELLEQLLDSRKHIAIVIDEYGGLAGLVTVEDIVETVLGMEIQDESDPVEDMQEYARARWRRRAKAMGIELPTDDQGRFRLPGGGPPRKL